MYHVDCLSMHFPPNASHQMNVFDIMEWLSKFYVKFLGYCEHFLILMLFFTAALLLSKY